MRKAWTDEAKNEAGDVVRVKTRSMGVAIHRQRSGTAGAGFTWSKSWYYPKMVNGIVERFPLGSDLAAAVKTADEIAAFLMVPTHTLVDAKRKYNPRALERDSEFSTIGDLFKFHREHWGVLDLSADTASRYQSRMLKILRRVDAWRKGKPFVKLTGGKVLLDEETERWSKKSLNLINAKLFIDYQNLMTGADAADGGDMDEEELLTRKITCDADMRNARALFSREARLLYKHSGLAIPDMTEALEVSLYNAKKYFELLPSATIRRLFSDLLKLKKADLNAYRIFLAAVQLGLRRNEIAKLQMDWFEAGEQAILKLRESGEFKPKHGHGRTITIDKWVWKEIRSVAASKDGYFLEGENQERAENAPERLIAWLQARGVDTTKPLHELRKLWFSQKVKRDGLLAAQQQGGHSDPKVTADNYADNMMPENLIPFWQLPVEKALKKAG